MAKRITEIRKMTDGDSFGSLLGQRLSSTYKRDEKDNPTETDILSRKRQKAIEEQFSNLKKRIDEDPYGVLFGRILQTKSPEDVPFCDSMNYRPSKSEGTSSERNARDLNDPEYGPSGPRQKTASRSKSESLSQNAATESVSELASQNDEFEFDPITMRKVPKKRSDVPATPPELGTDKSFSIPVKPFTNPVQENLNISAIAPDVNVQTSPQSAPSKPKTPTAMSTFSEPGQGWQAREYFDAIAPEVDERSPSLSNDASSEIRKAGIHKIESALDRHIKAMNKSSDSNPADLSFLKYPVGENTEDDVDLLQASDVRASVGLRKGVSKPTAAEKQERRSILSHDYESRSHQLDRRLEEELATQRAALKNKNILAEVVDSSPKCSKDDPVAISEIKSSSPSMSTDQTLRSDPESTLSEATSSSQREARKRIEARRTHEAEVNAQKEAMEAIETRDKIGPLHRNIESVQSQGPGESGTASNIDMFAGKTSRQESDQQLVKDQAFIRDIQSIYEDRYGIIDADHRQPSLVAAEISPIKTEMDNIVGPRMATNETLEQKIRLADAEKRAGDHQRRSNKSDGVHITAGQAANSNDQSCLESQDYKADDQSDTRRQLLKEVYETQNLIKDLSRRISESRLLQSGLTDSPRRPNVPEQSLQQSPNGSSIPCRGQSDSNGADGTVSDKQTQLHASSKPALGHSGSQLSTSDGSEAGETASVPVSYRILAYDPTTQRVTVAKNTLLTSPTSERRLTVAEALSGLANPAKFLPHFASLQNAGYEIVSGSSNLLIFQKTGSEKPLANSTDEQAPEFRGRYSMHTNPIDGTTPQTGNFASPTGFVNYDSILPTPDSEEGTTWQSYPRAPKPSDKVHREEAVFSGGWRDPHEEKFDKWAKFRGRQRRKRRWRRAKRMFWVGSCVAGCCYVAAVASEVFRGGASRKPAALPERLH